MGLHIQDFQTMKHGTMDRAKTINTGKEGPTLGVSSGIHGNEHFGVQVTMDFLDRIQKEGLKLLRGKLLLITAGNVEALLQDKRFLKDDLNRVVSEIPRDEIADNYEQRRGNEIKRLIDWGKPKAWLDLHSFSAPEGLPYAFSGIEAYNAVGSEIGIQNMAINMSNAKKATGGKLERRGVADYVNDSGAYGFTFEAGNHTDPQCLVNTYQALVNFLMSQDMIQGQKVEVDEKGEIHLTPHNDIIKIGGADSSHAHLEEEHIFTGGFRYAGEHPQSFHKYKAGDLIGYDIVNYHGIEGTEVEVLAPYNGYIIMPKDPSTCIKGKEVFYYAKDMSEVA